MDGIRAEVPTSIAQGLHGTQVAWKGQVSAHDEGIYVDGVHYRTDIADAAMRHIT